MIVRYLNYVNKWGKVCVAVLKFSLRALPLCIKNIYLVACGSDIHPNFGLSMIFICVVPVPQLFDIYHLNIMPRWCNDASKVFNGWLLKDAVEYIVVQNNMLRNRVFICRVNSVFTIELLHEITFSRYQCVRCANLGGECSYLSCYKIEQMLIPLRKDL